ncbi:MAG: PEGA domain-containing protein [Terriglobales bacterium]
MKLVSKLIVLVALAFSAQFVHAATTAANLEKLCNDWSGDVNAGGGYSLSQPMILVHATACETFITGYLYGINGTMGTDDKGVLGTYRVEKGVTSPQAVKVFTLYLSNHPEEENKVVGDVIFRAMTQAGLLTLAPQKSEPAMPLASIVVKSTPPGADINVDGKWMGSTPSTIQLAPGDHEISVEKEGLKPWQRTMTVTAGGSSTINATLEKAQKLSGK